MKILLWILAFIIGFFLFVKYLEKKSYYFPSPDMTITPESLGLQYNDVYFTTADNIELNGWFIPSKNSPYTIIFCHGNAGNISHRIEKMLFFNGMGISTFFFDYRGYGKSQGTPSEQGLYRDVQGAYDFVIKDRGIPQEHIILYGESIGGAVAIECAYKNKPGGLIIEDSFTSIRDMAKIYYPFVPRFLISNLFDSLSKIKKITCPKLIMHSKDDEIAPFSHGEKLFNEAQEPKNFLVLSGTHNEAFFISNKIIADKISAFIIKHNTADK